MFEEYGKKWLEFISAARLQVVANMLKNIIVVVEEFENWNFGELIIMIWLLYPLFVGRNEKKPGS